VPYLVVDIRSLDSYSGCEHAEEEGKLHCKGRRIGQVVRRNESRIENKIGTRGWLFRMKKSASALIVSLIEQRRMT